MKVPFVDLNIQYQNLKADIDAGMQSVIDSTRFIGGPEVGKFEQNFAELHEAQFCIATSSGTDALHLALWSLGIGTGEVIVPVNTFIATAAAVCLTGAKPVFVDIQETTFNIDPVRVEEAITENTKAIIPVHLYGQPADMYDLMELAIRHTLHIVEDACQAHLAKYMNRTVGTWGMAGCFSFYPSKNLGCFGEGGAVVTDQTALYRNMQMRRNHGRSLDGGGKHDLIGHNYRLPALQAAVLNIKMPHVKAWNKLRCQHADHYYCYLREVSEVTTPQTALTGLSRQHVYHLYVIRAERRDALKKHLEEAGIQTGIHYPIPLHLQPAFASLGYKEGDFPVAERAVTEILSLPMYPELTENQIDYVCEAIKNFY